MTAALIEEFTDWLEGRGAPDPATLAGHAELFLDWRGSAPLTTINDDDLREFLLGWCPRKLSIPAEESWEVCEAVGEFVFFLGSTGRMRGGPERARSMQQRAIGLIGPMMVRMADPANFGMAKSLFAGISGMEAMTQEELTAALQQRMDEHNALPLDQRRAATDQFFEPPMIETVELPFLYVPPSPADVEAAAARAVLPAKVQALRDYLGDTGKVLTATGNLKLADGRALVELLDTGDEIDPKIGEKTFKTQSTAELRRLAYLVEIALEAGAVRRVNERLVPVKRFDRLIRAVVAARRSAPDLQLVLVGTGPDRHDLEALVDELGASPYVRFAGRVEDDELVDLYRSACMVASSSVREGWGMTLTEAAACGTPAVASRISGHVDAVADGRSGLLAADSAEMVRHLDAVLGDPELRARLRAGALEHAAQYTWDATARAIFDRLVAR